MSASSVAWSRCTQVGTSDRLAISKSIPASTGIPIWATATLLVISTTGRFIRSAALITAAASS